MSQAVQPAPVSAPSVRYVSEKVVTDMTGIPRSTLQKDRHYRRGLPYIKLGKTVRYSLVDIHAFMNGHKIKHVDQ